MLKEMADDGAANEIDPFWLVTLCEIALIDSISTEQTTYLENLARELTETEADRCTPLWARASVHWCSTKILQVLSGYKAGHAISGYKAGHSKAISIWILQKHYEKLIRDEHRSLHQLVTNYLSHVAQCDTNAGLIEATDSPGALVNSNKEPAGNGLATEVKAALPTLVTALPASLNGSTELHGNGAASIETAREVIPRDAEAAAPREVPMLLRFLTDREAAAAEVGRREDTLVTVTNGEAAPSREVVTNGEASSSKELVKTGAAAVVKKSSTPVQCPRQDCGSYNTRFDYLNNKNSKQPRYKCKDCQRRFTLGGKIRNLPRKDVKKQQQTTMAKVLFVDREKAPRQQCRPRCDSRFDYLMRSNLVISVDHAKGVGLLAESCS